MVTFKLAAPFTELRQASVHSLPKNKSDGDFNLCVTVIILNVYPPLSPLFQYLTCRKEIVNLLKIYKNIDIRFLNKCGRVDRFKCTRRV